MCADSNSTRFDSDNQSEPHTNPQEYVAFHFDLLESIDDEIAAVAKRYKELLQMLNSLALEFIANAPSKDAAVTLASEVYWKLWRTDAKALKSALKHDEHGWKIKIKPVCETDQCGHCGASFSRQITSRTERQRYGACPACTKLIEQRQDLSAARFRLQREQERAEIERLKRLPYYEYLKTEHWQEMRQIALERAKYRCQLCNTHNTTLHVHHRTYERLGEEHSSDLTVLCAACHNAFHGVGAAEYQRTDAGRAALDAGTGEES